MNEFLAAGLGAGIGFLICESSLALYRKMTRKTKSRVVPSDRPTPPPRPHGAGIFSRPAHSLRAPKVNDDLRAWARENERK